MPMTPFPKPTCQELLEELRSLQARFRVFVELQASLPVLYSDPGADARQRYLEESQKLGEDVKILNEKFVPPEVQRLLESVEKQYDNAKEMALEFSPEVKIPSKELVMEKIRGLGAEKLKEIAKFGQPTLLMTPSTTMAEKEMVLDKKKRYPRRWGDACFIEDADHERWDPKPESLTVSIVEGLSILPELPDEILKDGDGGLTLWDFRYKKLYQQFQARGLRMITAHEYAILMQLSLKNYENAKNNPRHKNHQNPKQEIVDPYRQGGASAPHQPENVLTNMQGVPCGCFIEERGIVRFYWASPRPDGRGHGVRFHRASPGFGDVSLLARGAVQVFSL